MLTRTKWLVVVLVILLAGITIGLISSNETAWNNARGVAASEENAIRTVPNSTASSSIGTTPASATSDATRLQGSGGNASKAAPQGQSQSDHDLTARSSQGQSEVTPEVTTSSEDPDLVVGRAFPVSASVKDRCDSLGAARRIHCGETYDMLAKMQKERRDPTWASASEAMLRNLLTEEPGKFTIRHIECRTTICAVEYSAVGATILTMSNEFLLGSGLDEGIAMDGFETDAAGVQLVVTVVPFTRDRS